MDLLSSFLDKYRNLRPPHETVRKQLAETIFRLTGVQLSEKDIRISNRGAHLKVKPAGRSNILMKKQEILKELESLCGREAPRDLL